MARLPWDFMGAERPAPELSFLRSNRRGTRRLHGCSHSLLKVNLPSVE